MTYCNAGPPEGFARSGNAAWQSNFAYDQINQFRGQAPQLLRSFGQTLLVVEGDACIGDSFPSRKGSGRLARTPGRPLGVSIFSRMESAAAFVLLHSRTAGIIALRVCVMHTLGMLRASCARTSVLGVERVARPALVAWQPPVPRQVRAIA